MVPAGWSQFVELIDLPSGQLASTRTLYLGGSVLLPRYWQLARCLSQLATVASGAPLTRRSNGRVASTGPTLSIHGPGTLSTNVSRHSPFGACTRRHDVALHDRWSMATRDAISIHQVCPSLSYLLFYGLLTWLELRIYLNRSNK